MAELFDHIDELRRSPGKVAVATLVNTRGTTPRKEGAKMLVGEGGAVLGSVTIGGCVDAQVIEQTEDVLNTMKPRLLELNLGDEEAWEIGLTCGGTIEVFVEPLTADLLERVRAHTGRGGRAAIVTRLDGPVGAKLLVLDEPSANLDPRARRELLDVLERIDRTMLVVTHDLPFASELCERAVIISAGTIVADARCDEILSDAALLGEHDLELPAGFDPARVARRPRPLDDRRPRATLGSLS